MNKVICFHGSDFKSGTSMVSQCVAEQLAKEQPDKKILLLHMTNRTDTGYLKEPCGSIDELYNSLKNGIFTVQQLLGICSRQKNLYTLSGIKDYFIPDDVRYLPEMAEQLINTIYHSFDHIIIDAGNNRDIFFGLTIGALFCSELKYMLIKPQESYLSKYEELAKHHKLLEYDGRHIKFDHVVINQLKKDSIYGQDIIKKRLNLENLPVAIPHSPYGEQAEIGKNSLLCYKSKEFERAIKKITDQVTQNDKPTSQQREKAKQKHTLSAFWQKEARG